MICRACRSTDLHRVLDLGAVPAADHFPAATSAVGPDDRRYDLSMLLCRGCGLAQLAEDQTTPDEPRAVEPEALRLQAQQAVDTVAAAGWLRGDTVREFGSPHGGTWVPLLRACGYTTTEDPAAVVLDSFGIMHEPDQQAAFRGRAAATATDGVLLLQFHSLETIVTQGQWNALRHGHFAYYSLTTVRRLLADAGMRLVAAWDFALYGGTVLVAAVHDDAAVPDGAVAAILDREERIGITDPNFVAGLQHAADDQLDALRQWLGDAAAAGRRVCAYGAASRAVAMFAIAGVDTGRIAAVADASPAKQGRRMPATDVPIVSPEQLLDYQPDQILLTVPDLLPEVRRRFPQLEGRWTTEAEIAARAPARSRRWSA